MSQALSLDLRERVLAARLPECSRETPRRVLLNAQTRDRLGKAYVKCLRTVASRCDQMWRGASSNGLNIPASIGNAHTERLAGCQKRQQLEPHACSARSGAILCTPI